SVKPGDVRVRGELKEYVGPPYEIEGEIVLPEIAQVCAFIGTVFDTNTRGQLTEAEEDGPD
ncbi:hypothetical protein Tco_1130798, partial [Tanacetum coccineum]